MKLPDWSAWWRAFSAALPARLRPELDPTAGEPPVEPPAPAAPPAPPLVHLPPRGRRALAGSRAAPLLERPEVAPGTPPLERILQTLAWCDVERSARWLKEQRSSGVATFCNVYAFDVCELLQGANLAGYLPRVWWRRPERVTADTPARYGETLRELSANSLHDWLTGWAEAFGWDVRSSSEPRACHDLEAWARRLVDARQAVGLVCARQRDRRRSGHIAVVVPSALGAPGASELLQSQAGSTNRELFTSTWWRSRSYDSVTFAVWRPR